MEEEKKKRKKQNIRYSRRTREREVRTSRLAGHDGPVSNKRDEAT